MLLHRKIVQLFQNSIKLKESNVPPLNNDFESNVPQLIILDSRTFVAIRALSRFVAIRACVKVWKCVKV